VGKIVEKNGGNLKKFEKIKEKSSKMRYFKLVIRCMGALIWGQNA